MASRLLLFYVYLFIFTMCRRQQDEDRQVRCTSAFNAAGQIEGYASAAQCYWCAVEHDPFGWVHVSACRFEADRLMYIDENRQQLVNAGAIPVLVSLLNSPDTDVQYYCATALGNIAVDGTNRKILQSEPKLVTSLVMLTDSSSLKV